MDDRILIQRLPPKARRGSKPRCHFMLHGAKHDVAGRLNSLISPFGQVTTEHNWLPKGFGDLGEARLGKTPGFLTAAQMDEVMRWWLEVDGNTPNWDVASTCNIGERPGLLLVEAKSHDNELKTTGKGQPDLNNDNSRKNHERIGEAITQANLALGMISKGWGLSRDSHYQLCNRFSWAWKLASMNIPVVLIYLGFLRAEEMADLGRPFDEVDDWRRSLLEHCRGIIPESAWNNSLDLGGIPLCALIRSMHVSLPDLEE